MIPVGSRELLQFRFSKSRLIDGVNKPGEPMPEMRSKGVRGGEGVPAVKKPAKRHKGAGKSESGRTMLISRTFVIAGSKG